MAQAGARLKPLLVQRPKGLVGGSSVEAILARTEFYFERGSFKSALAEVAQLPSESASVMKEWKEALAARAIVEDATQVAAAEVEAQRIALAPLWK